MKPEVIAIYLAILFLIYLGGKSYFKPLQWILSAFIRLGIGAGALLAINAVGQWFHFAIPLNPYTALFVGFLGVPGVATLIILSGIG
ncbi:MAG TPA: pro-sigmaK processing inhibitor BofA family protein [Bacillota bacterium]|nr:pro-sigmaK processing inhibitor BofA family protein [Bacillota bacterium]